MTAGFTADEYSKIIKAMFLWEIASGGRVTFSDVTGNKQHEGKLLYIIKTDNWINASLGIGYHKQRINFVYLGDLQQRYILHELGHCLGLGHEHQRMDSRLYISVAPCSGECSLQLYPQENNNYDYQKYNYDYQSIMHYRTSDMCGEYIDGHGHELGNDTISIIDAMKVRDMYDESM